MNRTGARYPVCDLFVSVQGEGAWTGRVMGFLRFSGCPLACPWCDEPKHRDPAARRELTVAAMVAELERLGPGVRDILLTGGEPLAVPGLSGLVRELKARGYRLAMESSGVGGPLPDGLDWLTLSPKTELPEALLRRADEIKYVVGASLSPEREREIRARGASHGNVRVQPRADGARIPPEAVARCLELVLSARGDLRLSLQTHKWLGIP